MWDTGSLRADVYMGFLYVRIQVVLYTCFVSTVGISIIGPPSLISLQFTGSCFIKTYVCFLMICRYSYLLDVCCTYIEYLQIVFYRSTVSYVYTI